MPWSLPWAYPEYPRQEFNSAAGQLVPMYVVGDDPHYEVRDDVPTVELARVFRLIDNWRSSHSYPLNIFQAGLRTGAKQVGLAAVAEHIELVSPKISMAGLWRGYGGFTRIAGK